MVSLCVNLARKIGFRATEKVLTIFFDWLGVSQKIPSFTGIRSWMQRVGIAAIKSPVEKADDWVWLADHSIQIGPEKTLLVLGMRASKMPPHGLPLRHEDVRVLSIEPGTHWKQENVAASYERLAARGGAPRAVLSDGAVDLRAGAETLKSKRSDTIILGDFKHRAANILKAMLGKDKRFTEFCSQLGRTRAGIQQTELAHLAPPCKKQKARFMNLATTLNWATMVLWQADHAESATRQSISAERFEEKLGWVRDYAEDLAVWRECQQVISIGVTLMAKQGLFRGVADQFQALLEEHATAEKSREVARRLVSFIRDSESLLKEGERLPMSTEIVESTFALYKQLERQHSKGGFTGLLAAMGALQLPTTAASIRRDFANVSVDDVKKWKAENLGDTLTAKRTNAYRESKPKARTLNKKPATA
jgi:hypothetical protein